MARINCPVCGKILKVPDTAEGKGARCPACSTTFRIRLPGGAAPAASASLPSAASEPRETPPGRGVANPLLEALAKDARQAPAEAEGAADPSSASSPSSSSGEVGFAEEEPAAAPSRAAPAPAPPPWAPGARVVSPAARVPMALTPLRIGIILACLVLPVGLFLPWASGGLSGGEMFLLGSMSGRSSMGNGLSQDFSGLSLLRTAGFGFFSAKAWAFASAGLGAALFAVASFAGAASSLLSLRPGAKPFSLLCPALATAGLVIAAIGIVALQVTTGKTIGSVETSPFFWVVLVVCLMAGGLVFFHRFREGRQSGGKEGTAISPQAFGVTVVAVVFGVAAVLPWVGPISPMALTAILSLDGSGAANSEAIGAVRGLGWGGLFFCIGAGLSAVVALVWVTSEFGTPKLAAGAAALAGAGMIWFVVSIFRLRSIASEGKRAAGSLPSPEWGFYVAAVVVLAACLVFLTADRD